MLRKILAWSEFPVNELIAGANNLVNLNISRLVQTRGDPVSDYVRDELLFSLKSLQRGLVSNSYQNEAART